MEKPSNVVDFFQIRQKTNLETVIVQVGTIEEKSIPKESEILSLITKIAKREHGADPQELVISERILNEAGDVVGLVIDGSSKLANKQNVDEIAYYYCVRGNHGKASGGMVEVTEIREMNDLEDSLHKGDKVVARYTHNEWKIYI
jgi:hypothetical protein